MSACRALQKGRGYNMTAKDYLRQLKRLDTIITQKLQELNDLRATLDCLGGTDYSKERVQTSPTGDASFISRIHSIIEMETEIDAEIDRYIDTKHKIINQIQGLKDTRHIEILFKRYVEFKSIEAIADEMHYTDQYVKEMLGHALCSFQNTYRNEF